MPQVSKRPLDKQVEEHMFEVFQKAISNLNNSSDIENFLHEFLSPVEKIMLAKRLSIATLLERGFDYEMIKEHLHVTNSTIAKVNLQRKYAGDGYKKVVQKIFREESLSRVLEKVGDTLSHIPAAKGASFTSRKKH